MALSLPAGYAGKPLPDATASLLEILTRHGFTSEATTAASGKTLNISRDGTRCGYVNGSVLRYRGVIGYHFAPWGRPANDCPPEIAGDIAKRFCERYGCNSDDLVVQLGSGSNTGRTFLIIKTATVALRILLQDVGKTLDEAVQVTQIGGTFIEGSVKDVVMQKMERSSAARQACLSHYGYNCYACGTNLLKRYVGLPVELIHVHHEVPLASVFGEREVDPIRDMKPLCPNCHAVAHACEAPYSIEEIRRMFSGET